MKLRLHARVLLKCSFYGSLFTYLPTYLPPCLLADLSADLRTYLPNYTKEFSKRIILVQQCQIVLYYYYYRIDIVNLIQQFCIFDLIWTLLCRCAMQPTKLNPYNRKGSSLLMICFQGRVCLWQKVSRFQGDILATLASNGRKVVDIWWLTVAKEHFRIFFSAKILGSSPCLPLNVFFCFRTSIKCSQSQNKYFMNNLLCLLVYTFTINFLRSLA